MTLEQFKVWFEAFCEATDGKPTPEQFAKLKARVEALAKPDKARSLEDAYRDFQRQGASEQGLKGFFPRLMPDRSGETADAVKQEHLSRGVTVTHKIIA